MAEPSKKQAILIHVTKKQLDALLAPRSAYSCSSFKLTLINYYEEILLLF